MTYRNSIPPSVRPSSSDAWLMISPPNHGARAADNWADSRLGKMLAGKPMEQLAPERGWPELEEKLATPDFEFGIIAGGKGNNDGYLPTIPGDDDFLLSVDTMRLSGANDFIQTGGIHQLMAKYQPGPRVYAGVSAEWFLRIRRSATAN